ncbi:unnamed protein product [Echinostoma caproni]|uniref:ELL domain-containing protein n=1 Tax=Echinostoma caproni TaxID=27848 RepID=A0A183BA26_9TREM|nr:unnamed protein product [Echinostoma caproni]
MVRFTSTERAKQGEEEGSAKFARGNRLSMGEQVRCYKEECQRIFDLQNRVLSNPELLSSDEEVSSEEDEDETGEATASRAGASGATGPSGASHGATHNSSSIGGVRLSSLSSSARSYSATMSRNLEAVISNRMSVSEFEQRREEADREKLKRALESGEPILGAKRPRKTNPAAPAIKASGTAPGTLADHNTDSNPASITTSVTTAGPMTTTNSASASGTIAGSSQVYEASAQAAGTILDLAPPWPNATRKLLRIMRTYSEDGQQFTRTELVPWSPVVEIYLKIRQTRNDEFIHNFVDSDNQFREQQRKEKRRIQVCVCVFLCS